MKVNVDGKDLEFDENKSILLNLRDHDINIPTLCYQEGLKPQSRCRLCIVEVAGKLMTTCDNKPREGMKILTNSEKVHTQEYGHLR